MKKAYNPWTCLTQLSSGFQEKLGSFSPLIVQAERVTPKNWTVERKSWVVLCLQKLGLHGFVCAQNMAISHWQTCFDMAIFLEGTRKFIGYGYPPCKFSLSLSLSLTHTHTKSSWHPISHEVLAYQTRILIAKLNDKKWPLWKGEDWKHHAGGKMFMNGRVGTGNTCWQMVGYKKVTTEQIMM